MTTKKYFFGYFFLTIFFGLIFSVSSNAQILNSIGITGGITYSTQKWSVEEPATIEKYRLRYNGSIFAEFFNDDIFRWETEFEYNQKGVEEQITDTLHRVHTYENGINYLSFNNYLKIRYELFRIIPYVLIGPRMEYALSKQAQVFPNVIGGFSALHVSWAVGAGIEFVSYGQLKFFTEAFYNPDLTRAYNSNFYIKNKAFELKIGLKYLLIHKKNSCPAVHSIT
ncbi:MAG: outer membrane beta-barrel protein [Bacteroidia bacterium]